MGPLYAYDGASPFDLAAAKRHGAILITGYIVGHPGGMDPISLDRVRQIRALGMGFLPNWERAADYLVRCSKADGVAAGREAVAALRALGVPDDGTVACPFSWDVWVNPGDYAHCGQVADGIIAGLAGRYRFTAYGQGGLIDYFAQTRRLQADGWLSASSSFPGYDAASPRVALVQRIGSPVPGTDQDIVTDPVNVHAWWPDGSPYAQEANPLSDLTNDQLAQIAEAVRKDLLNYPVASPTNGTKYPLLSYLVNADVNASQALAKIGSVATVVNALAPRVAALQAAVDKLGTAVGALQPAAQVAVDVAAIAAATADAVMAKVKGLVLKVDA